MKNENTNDLVNKVLPGLFKTYFLPLLESKENITEAIKKNIDAAIAGLKIPRDKEREVFELGSLMFFNALLKGCYEGNFYRDERENRILAMVRQKALREFGLKLLAHYFADKLTKRKEVMTMYLVGMLEFPAGHCPIQYLNAISETNDPVLITGESGTGKEFLAQTIHYLSRRKREVFIPINCGGVLEQTLQSELFGHVKGAFTDAHINKIGAFQLANNGTLFLDEVGDMPLKLQIALLRTLNDGKIQRVGAYGNDIPVDVRIIAATNKNLRQEIKEGNFREDLYYRLFVHPIQLPAFRELLENERISKIRIIFQSVLHEQSAQDIGLSDYGIKLYSPTFNCNTGKWRGPLEIDEYDINHLTISKAAMERLISYDFPGNYRQIRNVISNAWVKTRQKIEVEHLSNEHMHTDLETESAPSEAWLHLPEKEFQARIEKFNKDRISCFLKNAGGNVSRAARAMGTTRTKLVTQMNNLGVSAKQ